MRRLLAALVFASLFLLASAAGAHGIYGHMHVTGWAVENMPDNDLKEFLSEPEVFEALLYGAAYTDSGYWIRSGSYKDRARAYAEYNHWPPFVYNAIEWLRTNDPPPFDTLESRKRVAFVMGIAAHGLQDEVFDSLFLYQVQEHDDAGQDEADRGTDGFMFLDDHVRMRPQEFLPIDMLIELYGDIDEDIDEETIGQATHAMSIYLDEDLGASIGQSLGEDAEDTIPWSRQHYLDPNIPGSLRAEIEPTKHYLEAVWERIHGRWTADQLVIHTYPAVPRRLLGHDHTSPDSWVTFIFGRGVQYGSGTDELADADGNAVAYRRDDQRWGGAGDWTRLASLKPEEDLVPGAYYTASIGGNMGVIGGGSYDDTYSFEFQVDCAEANTDACPELQIDPPTIDDPNPPEDAGDAGTSDAGDVVADSGPDVGNDTANGADTPNTSDGQGCTTTSNGPAGPLLILFALGILLRRRCARRLLDAGPPRRM